MDIIKMIKELEGERNNVDEALLALKRIAYRSAGKRRGRPPVWMTDLRRKQAGSATGRKAREGVA